MRKATHFVIRAKCTDYIGTIFDWKMFGTNSYAVIKTKGYNHAKYINYQIVPNIKRYI